MQCSTCLSAVLFLCCLLLLLLLLFYLILLQLLLVVVVLLLLHRVCHVIENWLLCHLELFSLRCHRWQRHSQQRHQAKFIFHSAFSTKRIIINILNDSLTVTAPTTTDSFKIDRSYGCWEYEQLLYHRA